MLCGPHCSWARTMLEKNLNKYQDNKSSKQESFRAHIINLWRVFISWVECCSMISGQCTFHPFFSITHSTLSNWVLSPKSTVPILGLSTWGGSSCTRNSRNSRFKMSSLLFMYMQKCRLQVTGNASAIQPCGKMDPELLPKKPQLAEKPSHDCS